jgi:hypothetical protein
MKLIMPVMKKRAVPLPAEQPQLKNEIVIPMKPTMIKPTAKRNLRKPIVLSSVLERGVIIPLGNNYKRYIGGEMKKERDLDLRTHASRQQKHEAKSSLDHRKKPLKKGKSA